MARKMRTVLVVQGSAGIHFLGKIGKEKLNFLPILMVNGKILLFPFHYFLPISISVVLIISFPCPSHPNYTYFFLPTSFLKIQSVVPKESLTFYTIYQGKLRKMSNILRICGKFTKFCHLFGSFGAI